MPQKKVFQHRKDKERQRRERRSAARDQSSSLTNPDVESPQTAAASLDVTLPSNNWMIQVSAENRVFCRVSQAPSTSAQPMHVSHTLTVLHDSSWTLHIFKQKVDQTKIKSLSEFPSKPNTEQLYELLATIDKLPLCSGHSDTRYIEMLKTKKGRILSAYGETSAYLDNDNPLVVNGKLISQTIRSSKCELTGSTCCDHCKKYLYNLRAMYHRWSKRSAGAPSSPDIHTNERYMNTPQKKVKMSKLRDRVRAAELEVARLQAKIDKPTETQGVSVDGDLHSDLLAIMTENKEHVQSAYPEGSFSRLFWEQQLKAASLKDRRQMKWHPVLIKWCLNLKLLSGAAYHAMRTSGFLALPSERTLRDYTHYFTSKVGFQNEVNQQLMSEVDSLSLPENRKYVGIIIDEMKVKEGLVFDKYTGEVIGFTNLGDVNNNLLQLENEDEHPSAAKYVLVLMVRGLLFSLQFPYAHFGTQEVTAELLFPIVWECIRRLEASGLKVIFVTADGASPNRKFFRMHRAVGDKSKYVYKTCNPYSKETPRSIYFFADPPHLLKTVRNCWSHSGPNGTRHMKV